MKLTPGLFSILLIHILIFSSCAKKEQSETQTAGEFSYKPAGLEKVYGVCDQPDTSCASIKIEYPEISKAPTDAELKRAGFHKLVNEGDGKFRKTV